MNVTSHEGLFRFLVSSGDKVYLVDLSSNNGLGECSCWDWISPRKNQMSKKNKVLQIISMGLERVQNLLEDFSISCKHMRLCRRYQFHVLHWHLIDENPHGDDVT